MFSNKNLKLFNFEERYEQFSECLTKCPMGIMSYPINNTLCSSRASVNLSLYFLYSSVMRNVKRSYLGSGALNGEILLARFIENNKIDNYFSSY